MSEKKPPQLEIVQQQVNELSGLIAQTDDYEILNWLLAAANMGGGFVQTFAEAGLRADPSNYALLRPVILQMRAKYPKYGKAAVL